MIKKFFIINFIIFIQFSLLNKSFANFRIIASVNEEIITNFDVLKESRYLKVLNPNLQNFEQRKLQMLAKESLIKQIIKKKEISKLINLDSENPFLDEYLKNLITKLGYKTIKDFNNVLLESETYSLEDVRYKIKIELFGMN